MPTFGKKIEDGQILLLASVGHEGSEKTYTALVDTGAQSTMVSPKVVEETDMKGIGYAGIVPVSGKPIQTPRYRAFLSIPISQGNTVLLSGGELEVAELPFQPDNFDILLGMDFLMRFHFTMYGGSFIMSN